MKQPTDSKCRMCYKAEQHIKHIVAGSTELAPSDYTNRHNKVAGYSHWTICKHLGLQVTDNSTTIMWDIPVITDRKILANQIDVVLHDKKEKTHILIDIAIPEDSNNTKDQW